MKMSRLLLKQIILTEPFMDKFEVMPDSRCSTRLPVEVSFHDSVESEAAAALSAKHRWHYGSCRAVAHGNRTKKKKKKEIVESTYLMARELRT